MKRKIYRIEQQVMTGVVNEIVLMASMSNGNNRYIPLQYMADYLENERMKYPVLTDGIKATISENCLLVDKTVGDKTENLLAITEVEIMELDKPSLSNQEAKDILTGTPTVDSYLNTGIADENHKECIN